MISQGSNLRSLRMKIGLTLSDVESASEQLARKHNNEEFLIPTSRLSDFETKGTVPGIHCLYSLAIIYRREFGEVLSWYGIDLNQTASDLEAVTLPRTHFSNAIPTTEDVTKPVRIDPSFDPRSTSNFTSMVKQWGSVPVAYLRQLSSKDYSYGYIGTEDLTMDPILPAGSFVQLDQSRNKILKGGWRSEYDRPIYFIETREGYVCSWCTLSREQLILLPHPLSPALPRVFSVHETEVVGQVIGVAMRLGGSRKDGDDSEDQENRR